eukprot:984142-Pyramimonas_sp.AAC.1
MSPGWLSTWRRRPCVVLTNSPSRPKYITCGEQDVRAFQHCESEKYLGPTLTLGDFPSTEFVNRVASGQESPAFLRGAA